MIPEDHSYANIEMQKVGYEFPLARADCYASDITMRQYSRLKAETGKRFHFNQMNKVYCIILMETSPREFHKSGGNFLHKRSSVFDTGIYKNNPRLHEDLFVCLDIFRSVVHNITVKCSLKDAWLTFLSTTNPSVISSLLEYFPEFEELYRELATFMMTLEELIAMISEELSNMNRDAERPMATEPQEKNAALEENKALAHEKNVWDAFNMPLEEALAIFSEGLRIMDRNTERLMVKELQAEKAVLEELIKIEKRKKVLQQKLDIFKLHKHEMSARQIADTLQISLEIVQEVLNV